MKIENVYVILGDGSLRYPEASPYDRIIITAACTEIPLPLIDQLKEKGKTKETRSQKKITTVKKSRY